MYFYCEKYDMLKKGRKKVKIEISEKRAHASQNMTCVTV